MPPLSRTAPCARHLIRLQSSPLHPRTPVACLAAAGKQQRRRKADYVSEPPTGSLSQTTATFESPFKQQSKDEISTTKIPSFKNYMSKNNQTANKTFQYFMVGGMGLLAAAGAKATVQGE